MAENEGLRRGGKMDRAMYYRRPDKGQHRQWLVVDSRTMLESFQIRGFEPLFKYGYIPYTDPDAKDDEGNHTLPLTSPWKPILQHPDGPKEFPVEQIISARWYIAEECPVPGAPGIFPQLAGNKITHYPCPECDRAAFQAVNGLGGIRHLATHLRLIHEWDRVSLMRYGEKVGIDFDVVYGDLKKSYDFSVEADTMAEVEKCDECDYVPAEGKSAAKALRMHKMSAHKPMEIVTVG